MNGFIEVLKTSRLTMSDDDLNKAIELMQLERKGRQVRRMSTNKQSMRSGTTVSFHNSRTQQKMTGEIVRVKTKKAIVKVGDVNWDVPLSMLSAE